MTEDNPAFSSISPEGLKHRLDASEKLTLIDVRESNEWEIGHIAGAELKPMRQIANWQDTLDPHGGPYVVYCHHGIRSARVCIHLAQLGVKDLINLTGGIDAWSRTIDPRVPLY